MSNYGVDFENPAPLYDSSTAPRSPVPYSPRPPRWSASHSTPHHLAHRVMVPEEAEEHLAESPLRSPSLSQSSSTPGGRTPSNNRAEARRSWSQPSGAFYDLDSTPPASGFAKPQASSAVEIRSPLSLLVVGNQGGSPPPRSPMVPLSRDRFGENSGDSEIDFVFGSVGRRKGGMGPGLVKVE
ncbi:hypothetical protein T439DRAFT_320432 [Meredithblackwellia eburnea MCA 4105]